MSLRPFPFQAHEKSGAWRRYPKFRKGGTGRRMIEDLSMQIGNGAAPKCRLTPYQTTTK